MLLRQIKALIGEARDNAMRDARRHWDHKFKRSRGVALVAVNKSGRVDPPEPYYDWDGTQKQIRDFAAEATKHDATHICFAGGIDGSNDFGFEDYEPEIETFEVQLSIIEAIG